MKLIKSSFYEKREKLFLKKHAYLKEKYGQTLETLQTNPFHPSLRYHELKNNLKGLSSVSINLKYRIIIVFVISKNEVNLIDIGSHDEVY